MKTETLDNGKTLTHWTPEEVCEALGKCEIVLIDVRTPQEYSFERIRGALLMPMQEFDPVHLPAPGEGRTPVFHCGSGARSRKMAEAALKAGWGQAHHMEGGFGKWKEAKLPYIGTDMSSGAPKEVTAGN